MPTTSVYIWIIIIDTCVNYDLDAQHIYMYIQEIFQMKNAKQDEFVTNHLVFAESLKEHYLNMHIGKTSVH